MAKPTPSESLQTQYGGLHTTPWISHLPTPLIPYIQLSRLSPPIALSLIYFPHLFGLLHTSILLPHTRLPHILTTSLTLLLFTFFFSNAAHAWNDLVDFPIDKLTSRTKNRPIPRGAISRRVAFRFALSQFIAAALVLLYLTPAEQTLFYFIPYLVATVYYPFAKRHTHFVQVVLGVTLAWGVVIGSAAVGGDLTPFVVGGYPRSRALGGETTAVEPSVLLLFIASATWTVIYDTIYAHQDLQDDLVNGVKSLAVLFRGWTKGLLWVLLGGMVAALVASGEMAGLSWWFGGIAGGGSAVALGAMIRGVDLRDSESCWWWFRYGYWVTGLSIVLGLGVECFNVRKGL